MTLSRHRLLLLLLTASVALTTATAQARPIESINALNADFWQWRTIEQPFTGDDIPRIDRPAEMLIDWSPKIVAQRLDQLATFESRWKAAAPPTAASIHDQVDYRLLGSAISRVRWELSVDQTWRRHPYFYVDQTVGSVFVLMLPPAPFNAQRQQQIIDRVRQIPATLSAAQQNLTDIRRPFAELAIGSLEDIEPRLTATETALAPQLTAANARALHQALVPAIAALNGYRAWLKAGLAHDKIGTAIGRENYLYFLHNIALINETPEQMLAASRIEWSRAVAFEGYQQHRLNGAAAPPVFPSADAQIAAEAAAEARVRSFLGEQKILTIPQTMQHYHNLLLPPYLAPLESLGVTDDLTGPQRLDHDGTSYIRQPSPSLGFFNLSTARDPRPILVHEGIPGHYFQLSLSWSNADPIRRQYYDSVANEGIGFYAEEMMLEAGFFDDNAQTRLTIYSFMRLRALRVEVDVKLALGEFTMAQAAEYLEKTVPMDHTTALEEAAMFASTPGQAISYQIGKLEINRLLADARRLQGKDFSFLSFNNSLWQNGNVPISLQRWELLHDPSDVPVLLDLPHQSD